MKRKEANPTKSLEIKLDHTEPLNLKITQNTSLLT